MYNNEYISEVEFIDIFADNLRDIMYEIDIREGLGYPKWQSAGILIKKECQH